MVINMGSVLSIIIPLYNEEESLPTLHKQLVESIGNAMESGLIEDYEIWFINDGSTDSSEHIIKQLIEKDDRVGMISFRKNFGKAAALQAGFRRSNGDVIITMDADLQDDPAEIQKMLEKLNEGYDLVSGWKKDRKDSIEKRLPSKFFNKVTSVLSGIKLHDFNCGFKAYDRAVIDSIDLYGELHRYIPVLAHRKGFRITEIPVTHHKREFGKSKYGFERYLRGLFDSLTTSFLSKFYDRPMYFFGVVGLILLVVGLVICGSLSIEWFRGANIGTRPILMLGVLCIILGVQSISTGFIGDLIVDATYRKRYTEGHIKEIIPAGKKVKDI